MVLRIASDEELTLIEGDLVFSSFEATGLWAVFV
jgi:hypothetical protein